MGTTVDPGPDGSNPPRARRPGALAAWLVALCAVLPYLAARDFGHVHDDHELRGPTSLALDPRAGLRELVTADVFGSFDEPRGQSGYWRPLVLLSFRAEAALAGLLRGDGSGSWQGYLWLGHVGTILAHVAACLALLALLRALSLELAVAFAAAALFAVHPVHVESVAWTSGRTESLPLALAFGAAAPWLRGARWGTVVATLGFLAALLCKESALVLVVLCALLAWAVGRRGRALVLPPLLAIGVALLLRAVCFGLEREVDPSAYAGPPGVAARWFTWLSVLPDLVGISLWPGAATPIRPVLAAAGWTAPGVLAGLALVLLLALAALLALARRRPVEVFLAALPAGTLLVLAPLVTIPLGFPEVAGPLADRYAYALAAAPCLLAARLAVPALARVGRLLPLLLVVPVIALGAASAQRCGTWRDDVAFARAGLAEAPGSPSLWNHLGVALLERLRTQDDRAAGEAALDAFRRALALEPGHELAGLNRFIALALLDRDEEAGDAARRLLARRPDDPAVLDNVAAYHARAGRWDDAIALYERELATGRPTPLARAALAAARAARERAGR